MSPHTPTHTSPHLHTRYPHLHTRYPHLYTRHPTHTTPAHMSPHTCMHVTTHLHTCHPHLHTCHTHLHTCHPHLHTCHPHLHTSPHTFTHVTTHLHTCHPHTMHTILAHQNYAPFPYLAAQLLQKWRREVWVKSGRRVGVEDERIVHFHIARNIVMFKDLAKLGFFCN